jgi:hypothetical protein
MIHFERAISQQYPGPENCHPGQGHPGKVDYMLTIIVNQEEIRRVKALRRDRRPHHINWLAYSLPKKNIFVFLIWGCWAPGLVTLAPYHDPEEFAPLVRPDFLYGFDFK